MKSIVPFLHGAGSNGDLQTVEYAQLPWHPDQQHSSSSAKASALLKAWLGTTLPQSCLNALQTVPMPVQQPDAAAAEQTSDPTDLILSQNDDDDDDFTARPTRQLLQDAQPSPSPAPSPAPSNASDTAAPSQASSPAPAPSPAPKQPSPQDRTDLDSTNSTTPANTTTAGDANNSTMATVCALQPETGPCRAAIPRWAFDVATKSCKAFVYGGCNGNANNFQSEQDCENACMRAMNITVAASPEPVVVPTGPVATSVDAPRVLAGSAPASSRAAGRSWGEQLLRVVLAGLVGVLAVLML